MKKLSIVAVICIIAMLFASCSGSTPAPTEPNDTQKAAVLSIISAAANADYEGVTELKLDDQPLTEAQIGNLFSKILTGEEFKISANVTEDFVGDTTEQINSGKVNLSIEAKIKAGFVETPEEGCIIIDIPDVITGYILVTKAEVTLKSSNTNFNATIGEKEYDLTLDVNTQKNLTSIIKSLADDISSAISGSISGLDMEKIVNTVFDAFGESAFTLQLNGTRIQVKPIIDALIGLIPTV